MKRTLIGVVATMALLGNAMASEGLETRPSPYTVAETMDRLEAAVRSAGTPVSGPRIFARIDFQQLSGGKIRPNQAILFGSGGALPGLADRYPTATMDLPIKVLVWEDEGGKAWISYNSAAFLKERHKVAGGDNIERIDRATKGYIDKALK